MRNPIPENVPRLAEKVLWPTGYLGHEDEYEIVYEGKVQEFVVPAKVGILFYQNIKLIEEIIKEKNLQAEEKAQLGKTMPSLFGRTSNCGLQMQSWMCQKTPISIRRWIICCATIQQS